jgi:hypothetical protein
MNVETIAIENQAATTEDATCCSDQLCEITPMSMDCFKLVGGGSAIIVLG